MKKILQHKSFFILYLLSFIIWLFCARALLNQSIRLDESQSLWVAIQSPQSLLTWVSEDVHVPLYHMLLHVYLTITGFSLSNARLFSSFWYLATIPLIYLIAIRLSQRKVALLATFLASLSPFLIWYAFEVRMYTLFLFLSTAQLLSFINLLQNDFRKGKFLYFLTTSAGLYTHYFFVFQLIAQGLYFIGGNIYNTVKEKTNLFQGLRPTYYLILMNLLSAATLAPWIYFVAIQGHAATTKPLIPPPNTYTLFQTITQLIFGFQTSNFVNVTISLWPLTLVVMFYLFTKRARAPLSYSGLLLMTVLAPLGIVYLASQVQSLFLTRYFTLVAPSLIILIAWFIQSYRRLAAGILVVILSITLTASLLWQNTNAQSPVKENYAQAAEFLHQNASVHDVIAVSAPFTIYPLEFYYQGITRVITVPNWDRYNGKSIETYDQNKFENLVTELQSQYHLIHFVLSYDQGYEADLVRYMDNHYELIHSEQISSKLQIRSYKISY